MEFIGPNTDELEIIAARAKERAGAWKWRFALLRTVVAKRNDGSLVRIWLRFYERRRDGDDHYQVRYRHYPELRLEIPRDYGYY